MSITDLYDPTYPPMDPDDFDRIAPTGDGDCTACEGVGETWTGRTEPDTDAPLTTECRACAGTGMRGAA